MTLDSYLYALKCTIEAEFKVAPKSVKSVILPNGNNGFTTSNIEVIDPGSAISNFFIRKIDESDLAKNLERELTPKFKLENSADLCGYWGSFRFLFRDALHSACVIEGDSIKFQQDRFMAHMQKVQQFLESSEIEFISRARVFGIALKDSEIPLTENILLKKLEPQEIYEEYLNLLNDPIYLNFEHNALAVIRLKVKVNRAERIPYMLAMNQGSRIAGTVLEKLLLALKIARHGFFFSITRTDSSFLINQGTHIQNRGLSPRQAVSFEGKDVVSFEFAHRYVTVEPAPDQVLARAFSRFSSAKQRESQEDRLIDFIICLESILLTSKSGNIPGELTYKFSINGGVLSKYIALFATPMEAFKFFKVAYSLRSKLVHGSNEGGYEKELKKVGFNSLVDFNDKVEECCRLIIFWLLKVENDKRPYELENGWENLVLEGK